MTETWARHSRDNEPKIRLGTLGGTPPNRDIARVQLKRHGARSRRVLNVPPTDTVRRIRTVSRALPDNVKRPGGYGTRGILRFQRLLFSPIHQPHLAQLIHKPPLPFFDRHAIHLTFVFCVHIAIEFLGLCERSDLGAEKCVLLAPSRECFL